MSGDPPAVAMHTPYKDVLELITARDVGAVAVVSSTGRVVGVVAEADLLDTRRRSARDGGRLTAGALMSSPVISVRSDATLAHAARVLAGSGKRQVFVIDDGRLVGMLARRDVLRPFLRPDEEIRAEVEHHVLARPAAAPAPCVRVSVERGIVQLTGRLPWRADIDTAVARAAVVPGVIGVRNRLVAAFDGRRH